MLGRVQRTTRTDVALALTMAGFSYLAYVLACYMAKSCAAGAVNLAAGSTLARTFHATFHSWEACFFDFLGPLWMLAGLYMVIRASRQHRIISWSWLLISCQAVAAILIASWAALAARTLTMTAPAEHVNWSPVLVALATLTWVGTLVWLIVDRARLKHYRGPSLGDGQKTMAYRGR